ncbi:hypothetical protein [Qipengyuania sp. 902]|uniref:hypothetical protein n=1 Tax=Qipengyuania sp. 902 TaxID=3417565 RepID=UPI003EB99B61
MEHDFNPSSGTDLEHLASQLDRAMATLARTEQRLASPQILPGETVFRDPKDAYHQITLGAVLIQYGLNAHHACALDGLLSMTFEQLKALAAEALQIVDKESDDDDETMGSGLLKLLELMPTRLEQFGRYAEWRRGFDRYMEKTRPYLDGLTDGDLHRLAGRPPSKKQMHLIRVTCAYHGIAFPAVPDRRAAFEWLRDIGANVKYREVRS